MYVTLKHDLTWVYGLRAWRLTSRRTVYSTHLPGFFLSANHRRAGQAVTNILAKELTQEDKPSKPPKMKVAEPKLEGAESLEELLDAALTRSS